MPNALYVSAEGAHAQSTRLDVIAHNLANVDTVGFKRELAVFQARYSEAIESGQQAPGLGSLDDIGGGIEVRETVTDFASGPLKKTGNRTDVAIRGDGVFFQVRKYDEVLLTRAGNFTVDPLGRLTTQQGYEVLSDTGEPILISDPKWQVDSTAAVRQLAGSQNLALVRPELLANLVRVGENLFRPTGDPVPVEATQRAVAPESLELSGVQPTTEMVEMIQASRALEANVNMMKAQDQMLSGLVNRVMRVA